MSDAVVACENLRNMIGIIREPQNFRTAGSQGGGVGICMHGATCAYRSRKMVSDESTGRQAPQ